VSMFVFSLISTALVLWLIPPGIDGWSGVKVGIAVALCTTITEAVSPWGLDNLTIPAISGLVLYWLLL